MWDKTFRILYFLLGIGVWFVLSYLALYNYALKNYEEVLKHSFMLANFFFMLFLVPYLTKFIDVIEGYFDRLKDKKV